MSLPPKPWYLSRVLWLNVGLLVLAVAEASADIVPAEYQPLVLAAAGLLNAILRLDTKRPVTR